MFQFKHPFTCIIAGPTQSGKTHFTRCLIEAKDSMITPVPNNIIWCHGQEQQGLHLPDDVKVHEGLDILSDLDGEEPTLIILDDLMQEGGGNKEVVNLFTKGSHHKNLSVIMLIQNVFHQGKYMRTMSLNTHYMVLFKNPRDASQITHLAKQLFPKRGDYLVDAYKQATKRSHGYLVLDFTQNALDHLRVVSDILPGEDGYYYIPK